MAKEAKWQNRTLGSSRCSPKLRVSPLAQVVVQEGRKLFNKLNPYCCFGVFVTLYRGDEVFGCVGNFVDDVAVDHPERVTMDMLKRAAVKAALDRRITGTPDAIEVTLLEQPLIPIMKEGDSANPTTWDAR